jgi:hypothetical protein
MHNMEVEVMTIAGMKPYPRNARAHSERQIRQIAKSIERQLAAPCGDVSQECRDHTTPPKPRSADRSELKDRHRTHVQKRTYRGS